MAKKPTLRDVSHAAGVSVYTVSQALNDGPGVATSTRAHVLETAQRLGYVANRSAQELRKKSHSSIAVVTASVSNYYYLDMMRGIQRVLRAKDRAAVVADIAIEGRYSRALEDASVRQLIQARAAGVVATLTLRPENVELLNRWEIPIVFVDSAPPPTHAEVPRVSTDNIKASATLGEHLQGHGYRRWLFVAYPSRWSSRADRERGLRLAADRAGATLEVLESDNDPGSSFDSFGAWLDSAGSSLPDVLIAGNNPLLDGMLRALDLRGIHIPQDTALVAFDEFPWAPYLNPPLTVLNEDSESIGACAATILNRILDEKTAAEKAGQGSVPIDSPTDRVEVDAHLIVRRSCGC